MTVDRRELEDSVTAALAGAFPADPMTTAARAAAWLAGTPPRRELDALCRQIDVRRMVATQYGDDWARHEPETLVDGPTMAGLVTVLLRAAGTDAARADGWSLKGVNSALKALDAVDVGAAAPGLRAWALELLDAGTGAPA